MSKEKFTLIRVAESTKAKLESLGKYGDSMNDIIIRLLLENKNE